MSKDTIGAGHLCASAAACGSAVAFCGRDYGRSLRRSAKFNQIPISYFNQIRANYNFFYGHTSHGSQIMTGLDMLETENATLYALPSFSEYGSDLGYDWVTSTREYLDTHPECNFVMWSWCGQVSEQFRRGYQQLSNRDE